MSFWGGRFAFDSVRDRHRHLDPQLDGGGKATPAALTMPSFLDRSGVEAPRLADFPQFEEKVFLFNAGSAKFPLHSGESWRRWQAEAEVLQEDKLVLSGLADAAFSQGEAIAGWQGDIDQGDLG